MESPEGGAGQRLHELAGRDTVLLARSNYHVHGLGRGGTVRSAPQLTSANLLLAASLEGTERNNDVFCRWNVTYGRIQQLSLPYLRSVMDDPAHAELPFSTKGAQLPCALCSH